MSKTEIPALTFEQKSELMTNLVSQLLSYLGPNMDDHWMEAKDDVIAYYLDGKIPGFDDETDVNTYEAWEKQIEEFFAKARPHILGMFTQVKALLEFQPKTLITIHQL